MNDLGMKGQKLQTVFSRQNTNDVLFWKMDDRLENLFVWTKPIPFDLWLSQRRYLLASYCDQCDRNVQRGLIEFRAINIKSDV